MTDVFKKFPEYVSIVIDYQDLRFGYERIAEFYDLFAENDDIPFYLKMAEEYGSPVLDLAAGTGRVAIPLVTAGHFVTALEKSPSMLAVLYSRRFSLAKNLQTRLTVVKGDMRNFNLEQKFPLIIIPASFGHAMTTDEQLSVLQCVREHLTPDGIFVLDLFPGGAMPEHSTFENAPVKMSDGRLVSRRGTIDCDYVKQILTLRLVYTILPMNGDESLAETIEAVSGAAIIFNREANLLIALSGLKIERELGGFDERPYSPDCGRRILLLRKL